MLGAGTFNVLGAMFWDVGGAVLPAFVLGWVHALFVSRVFAYMARRFPHPSSVSHWVLRALDPYQRTLGWTLHVFAVCAGLATAGQFLCAGVATVQGLSASLTGLDMIARGGDSSIPPWAVALASVAACMWLCRRRRLTRSIMVACTCIEVLAVLVFVALAAPSAWQGRLGAWDYTAAPASEAAGPDTTHAFVRRVLRGAAFVTLVFGGFEAAVSHAGHSAGGTRDRDPHAVTRALPGSVIVVGLLNLLIIMAFQCVMPHPKDATPDVHKLTLARAVQKVVPAHLAPLAETAAHLAVGASCVNTLLGVMFHVSRTMLGMAKANLVPGAFTSTRLGEVPFATLAVTAVLQFALWWLQVALEQDPAALGRAAGVLMLVSFLSAEISLLALWWAAPADAPRAAPGPVLASVAGAALVMTLAIIGLAHQYALDTAGSWLGAHTRTVLIGLLFVSGLLAWWRDITRWCCMRVMLAASAVVQAV